MPYIFLYSHCSYTIKIIILISSPGGGQIQTLDLHTFGHRKPFWIDVFCAYEQEKRNDFFAFELEVCFNLLEVCSIAL